MNLIKRIKTIGLAAVMASGVLLSSFAGITASATMNDNYYNARTGSSKISVKEAATSPDYPKIVNDKMPSRYQYNMKVTENTKLTVNKSANPGGITEGVWKSNGGSLNYYKLQDSWKGNITATYTNCGYYNGKIIDVKLTLMDWEFLKNNQSDVAPAASNVYLSFTTDKIGVGVAYCSWVKIQYSFINHATSQPINVYGYTTYNDIDACQGVHFTNLGPNDQIFTSNATGDNLSCAIVDGAPYIFDGSYGSDGTGTGSEDEDKKHWITNTFSGTSMTVAFTFGLNGKVSGTDQVRGGTGAIINYNKKAVQSEFSKPTKTVSDSDEDAIENTLQGRETFTYKISYSVPYETADNYYQLFGIRDNIPSDLSLISYSITDETGKNLKSNFTHEGSAQNGEHFWYTYNVKREDFYDHTYTLTLTVRILDSVDISSKDYTITNTARIAAQSATLYIDTNTVTTKVQPISPSISKHIKTNSAEVNSYSLHNNSEDIKYTGEITLGDAKKYSKVEIKDTLAEGLKYKSMKIYNASNNNDVTSYFTNSSSNQNIKFTLKNDYLKTLFNTPLKYELVVTASKTYDGTATQNEDIPNTISLTVNDETVQSNTPMLYRSGVNVPEKSIDKTEVSEKTDTVTYTISNKVDAKTSLYHYNSYVLSDKLDDVLEYKSARVLNESGTNVSSSFEISHNSGNNTVTATARDTSATSFYGHTYKLEIQANIKKNADLSSYLQESKAVIPNISKLTVDGNDYPSNTVEFNYEPKGNNTDKYIINLNGEKVEATQLNGSAVKYKGSATIQNKEAIASIVLSDKLDKSLKYKSISISFNDDDITNWGTVSYNEDNNTVDFTFNSDRVASLAGETIEYTLTCEYVGEYTEKDIEIPNTVTLSVNNKVVESNQPKLHVPGVNTPIKSVDKSEISDKTETVTYTISNEVDSKTQEYFYNSYIITDSLEDVLKYKSARVINESGTNVSDLFTIVEDNNTVTATAKDTSATNFYGHTYKLEIKANLIQNADLSGYIQGNKAVIPNTSKLTVNRKDYQSNTVNVSYIPKSNEVDKYIVDSDGEKLVKVELFGDTVTYTGEAVIQDKTSVKSVVLSDKLDSNLKYKDLSVTLDEEDISDWGTAAYDKGSNTVTFTFNSEKVALLAGKTIEYTLTCDFIGELTNKSISISNIITLTVNDDPQSSNEAILTTPVDPSITKYINEEDESYSLHKNSEDITYTGTIIPGTHLKTSLSIKDNLADGLAYKSLKIFSENGSDITSYGTNSSSGSTVSFVFNEDKISEIYNTILRYKLVVTASKTYDGTATKNEETPNTILLLVEDETVQSNTPKLYRSGVNSLKKGIDKSEISEKTETVTYTISNVVDSKTQEYFYSTYVISDTLENVLQYKSSQIINEDGTDVSDLFTISVNGNTITATANNTNIGSFYGHTYSLVIQASIISRNTDISSYCDKDGKATIPNTSTLTVDGNVYPSNTVNFTYKTKSNSVDKYILDLNGEKSTEAQLYDNVVTYTGNAVIKDSAEVTSIVLSDKLDSNLKYKAMKVSLDDKDITDLGNISYDKTSNTVSFSFNKNAFSSVVGETIEYALTCDYVGKYSSESKNISNIIDMTVNEETEHSNDTTLKIPVDSYITKHIYNGDKLVNEYTLSADRKDNKVYYEGSILVSEKEPIDNIVFSDKLDSNLEFESISFLDGSTQLECNSEYKNGIVKAALSDNAIKNLEGKLIQWKMTCNYVGDEKPTETVTIPNTANVNINDDSYASNEAKAYVSMVSAYEATQKTTAAKAVKTVKNANATPIANSNQPDTGTEHSKAPIFLFAGLLLGAAVGVVYRFRKIKKDGKKNN